jgi:hypothetical protein
LAGSCSGLACLLEAQNISLLSSAVTALATIALFFVTWVLARETKILSRASSQAHVTATIEPNIWAINYTDIIIQNSGNAVAYDITVDFSPPIVLASDFETGRGVPFQKVSILRPGQKLQSSLSSSSDVMGKTFCVFISWKLRPRDKRRENLTYQLSMLDYDGVGHLGAVTPAVQIAEQIKKLREDWQNVANGSRRVKTDVHSSADRDAERLSREQRRTQMRHEQASPAESSAEG